MIILKNNYFHVLVIFTLTFSVHSEKYPGEIKLSRFNQNSISKYIFIKKKLKDYTTHPCIRPCNKETRALTCEYDWVKILLFSWILKRIFIYLFFIPNKQKLTRYRTVGKECECEMPSNCRTPKWNAPECMPANGIRRSVLTINRLLPGPPIEVCKNDLIRVKVHNDMDSSETSIHWHGILQRGY